MAEEIAGEIARKLFGLWGWKRALREIYAPNGLELLANQWLRINAAPTFAFARVVEIDYRGHVSKYIPLDNRKDNRKDNRRNNRGEVNL